MHRTALTAWLLVAAIAGCDSGGTELYPVSGTVTFDGQPLPDAEILFVPADGNANPSPGRVTGGKYELKSPPGKMKVEIRATREYGEVDPAMGARPQKQYLPSRYNSASELTAEVKADGHNEFPFSLTEK